MRIMIIGSGILSFDVLIYSPKNTKLIFMNATIVCVVILTPRM